MVGSVTQADIDQIINIIQHLYSPTSTAQPHQQQEVQRQLVEAQKSDASWGLIGPLLSHSDRNVRFFGAHTASVKITRDWETLPEEQRTSLLNSMLEWTGQTAALDQENAVVLRKLFVALSSLIIRLSPNAFPHPLLTLLTLLTPAPSPSNPPSLALPLEFFQIVIEEVSRTGLIGVRKSEIHDVLEDGSQVAVGSCLGVLRRWLEDGGGDTSRQREEELSAATSCLEAWIGWGLSGELLHQSLPLLIALLSHSVSFVQASDCLQQVLTESVLKDGRGSKVLTEPILAWLPSIAGAIAESCFSTGDVDETSQSLCKLLVALGEHSADYLALNLALPQVQTFFTLMLGFSSLQGYYGIDEDVSEMTLGFWSLFQEALTASPHIETSDAPVPGNEWIIALEVFGELLRRMRVKCILPRDGGGWMKDQVDKFRIYRNDVGDTLVTAYYVLRSRMLSFLINSILSDLSSPQPPWEEIEATLHCLRAAQEAIPEDEDEFLPRFFSPEILGRLPTTGDSRARATTLALLGDYSSWFHSHPSHVISAISYIVPALEVPSLCASAAQALKTLCDLCRKSLTGHIGEFGSLYSTVEDRIDPEEKAKVLEAITSVVQALPPLDAVEPVKAIVDPIVNKLLHALSLSDQLPAEAKTLAIQQVISLTAVAKGITPLDDFDLEPEAEEQMFRGDAEKARADPRLIELRTRMLQGIARMVELWSIDGETADEISRLLRSMTTSTTAPTLLSLDSEPLIRLVASAAERNLNGVWLSLAEILVGRLAPPPGFGVSDDAGSQKAQRLVREVAGSMIWAGASSLTAGAEVMSSNPDVVEGLFKFAGTVAARFPVSLLAPPHEVLNTLMQLSIVGLGLQERYSIQAVTGFLTTTLSRSRSPQDLHDASNIVLRAHGHAILQAILFGAGGHCPRSVIPHLAELLASLVSRIPEQSSMWLTTLLAMEGFPDPRATVKAKEKLKNAIFKGRTTKKVREALNEFALVSLDSPTGQNHARQPSSISSSSSSMQPPSSSGSSSQHSYSYSEASSQRSTASVSTLMDPSSSSSTSIIPSTSITPSSPAQTQQSQQQRPSLTSTGSGGSVARPSMDGGRSSASGSYTMGGGGSWGAASGSRHNLESAPSTAGAPLIGSPVPIEISSSSGGNSNEIFSGSGMPLQFDEGVLRQLCELDCALPLLTDRIKQSLASCRQVSLFFKARSRVESAYAASLEQMGKELLDNYSKGEGKAGSFLNAYKDTIRIHDALATQRSKFSTRLNEMSEELNGLAKEMEKTRKQHKETGARHEKTLQDADLAMEKAKVRFDTTAEELERILILKEGGNLKDAGMHNSPGFGAEGNSRKKLGKAIGKGAGLFKGKNPAQLEKQEVEVRERMSVASEAFSRAVVEAKRVRTEHFHSLLPQILRQLKQCADEVDLGTQYHISRYAYLYETVVLQEGSTLSPVDGLDATTLGLKAVAETIDNRTDFKLYMQNFIVARGNMPRGPRRENLYEEGYQPPLPPHVAHSQNQASNGGSAEASSQINPKATFEVDLSDAMQRDGVEVPRILEMCTEAIERKGLTTMGIYRLSGTTSAVQKLKAAFDQDVDSVDLDDDAWADINVVASTLKLWFRELPDPLFTFALYPAFMEAARTDNDRLRHIRLHEQVNELPDANYAALKFFMSHLHKIRAEEKTNQMSASNLSIVFGPTLFRSPPEGVPGNAGEMSMADAMSFQCKAVETILLKYEDIFI